MSNVTRVFIDGSNRGSPEKQRENALNRSFSSSSHYVERKYVSNPQERSPHYTNPITINTSRESQGTYYYGSADKNPREGYTTHVPINSFMGLHITPSKSTDYHHQTSHFANKISSTVNSDYNYDNHYERQPKDNYNKSAREQNFSPTYRNVNINAGQNLVNPLCIRCSKTVYSAERIEPTKKRVFHTACFKCVECGVKLTIKTYYQNLRDKDDIEIYCKSHQPQLSAAKIDATAKSIQAFSNKPKLSTVNEQIRGPGTLQRQAKIDASAYDSYSPNRDGQKNEMQYTTEHNYSETSNIWNSRQRRDEPINAARSIPIERESADKEIRADRYDSPIRYDSPGRYSYDSPKYSSTPAYGIGSPVTNSYGFNSKTSFRSDFSPEGYHGSPPKSGYGSPQHPSYEVSYGSSPQSRYDSPPKASYNSPPRIKKVGSPPVANYNSPPRGINNSPTKSGIMSSHYPKHGSPPKSGSSYSSKSNYSHHQRSSQNHSRQISYEPSPPRHDSGYKSWMNHF